MPRIAEGRAPAEPSSTEQKERYRRILRAASVLGAEHGFERVQMHDVAKDAGVAIATLYRYFPSKTHLFSAVMHWSVSRVDVEQDSGGGADPATAVGDLLVRMSELMAQRPKLSLAMIQANNQAQSAALGASTGNDRMFRQIILDAVGVDDPTDEDERRVRLIVHCWYGVLMSILNGRLDMEEAEGDVRAACELLVGHGEDAALHRSPATR